jgi:hypothetical protein
MNNLYQKLKAETLEWREKGYPSDYPAIATILKHNQDSFLRKAQLEALEVYWYLRLVKNTPHIFDLYKEYFEEKELLEALGIKLSKEDLEEIALGGGGLESIIDKVRKDDAFVKKNKLQGLRETLNLNYPSYILALAMGAGKTILIASIIATEFAMALEYDEENGFIKNALVFAPGKTILGALREISETPYEKILPKRFYKSFITNVKFTYTRDGEKDIPVIRGSSFNVVVTNTEKIRLQKSRILKSYLGTQLSLRDEDSAKQLIANQRLQSIVSLPHLAVFSDEAHHTYGQKLEKDLKRVRQTINYINRETNLMVVINTTGTPYYKRQLLRDVVYWYGLSQGIGDGILKEVRGNIVAYDNVTDKDFIIDVVKDFFANYKDVTTENGSKAKIAIYFPKRKDLEESKPIVEQTLISLGIDPSIILPVHYKSKPDIKDLFDNRINDPDLPYRVFLLVNKGTEGWNCPSLFATSLARKLKSSNNFVLQAASRCLRQIPNNTKKAKIYLSGDNVSTLDKQLQETYGESLEDIRQAETDVFSLDVTLKKVDIEPLVIKKVVQKFVPSKKKKETEIKLNKPEAKEVKKQTKVLYNLSRSQSKRVLVEVGEEELSSQEAVIDLHTAAVMLAQTYRLDSLKLFKLLSNLYGDKDMSAAEFSLIRQQLEDQVVDYDVVSETVEQALALVKEQGFEKEKKDGKSTLVTTIRVKRDRLKNYVLHLQEYKKKSGQIPLFGFHYTPYNFDSTDEREFFERMLSELETDKDDVEDIYYTGALTDRERTEFVFEYKDEKGEWHNYTPDFLIRKKDGKSLIVEVKGKPYRNEQAEKEMKKLEEVNHEKLKYELLLLEEGESIFGKVKPVLNWIYNSQKGK